MENYFYIPGNVIRHFRLKVKLTQEQLAESVGFSRVQVNGWESKELVKFKAEDIEALAKALKVKTNDLTSFQTKDNKMATEYLNIHREVWNELKFNNRTYKESLDKLIAAVDRTMDNLSKPGNRKN